MAGQGAIIAAGAIDYPAEYQGAAPETRSMLGISKVMSLSCTYDHRIIQGAESGMFLGKLQALLDGADGFYEEIFAHLKHAAPAGALGDRTATCCCRARPRRRTAEIAKEAGVMQLINAYRVRGHLIADLDPLGGEPSYHPELDPETYGLTIWDLDREFLTGSLSEAIGEHGPQAGGHAARNPGDAAPDLLRQNRLRVHEHPACRSRSAGCSTAWSRRPTTGRSTAKRACAFCSGLLKAEEFEHFLHARFVGQKRFALEGAETAIPILDEIAGARRREQRTRSGHGHGASRASERADHVVGKPVARDLLANSKANSIRPARRAPAT